MPRRVDRGESLGAVIARPRTLRGVHDPDALRAQALVDGNQGELLSPKPELELGAISALRGGREGLAEAA